MITLDQNERINHLLWMQMEFHVVRYLISNTAGRLDGYQKAHHHMKLTEIYLASLLMVDPDDVFRVEEPDGMELQRKVHDHTQELTAYMDDIIGFPIDGENPDYKTLKHKFFKKFIILADEAVEMYMEENNLTYDC